MFQKLDDVVLKHKELTEKLMDPEVVSDPKKIMEYNKALNSIDEVVKKYTYYKSRKEELEGLKEDLKIEKDAEMKEMMHEEIHLIEEEIPHLEEELKVLLLPKDPNDDKNVIMESVLVRVEMKQHYLQLIFSECLQDMQKETVGKLKSLKKMKSVLVD